MSVPVLDLAPTPPRIVVNLSPVEKVPPEILVEIFKLLPELPSASVMLVCRWWHDVCVSATSLWTDVVSEDWDVRAVACALKYSEGRPKSLHIRDMVTWDATNSGSQLRQLAPSLRVLDVTGRSSAMSRHAASFNGVELTQMSFLRLWTTGLGGVKVDISAPLLRELYLKTLRPTSAAWDRLPSSLTHLELSWCGPLAPSH
ncbi:hypothetical protein MKEN_01371000 [Mycena kentingensis (nom. inval.)]|nr:hypothetical protein MKEN_01371000 [Mycena kentingensis (nom. inval.)]